MTAHPLSIRKQLLIEHTDIDDVRFEFLYPTTTVFRLKLTDGTSGHHRPDLHAYLQERAGVGDFFDLAPWVDGPPWPPDFDALNADLLRLAEHSRSTSAGLVDALVRGFDFLADAEATSDRPGTATFTVFGREGRSLARSDLRACEAFLRACTAQPSARVRVVEGPATPESAAVGAPPRTLARVADPFIRRLAEEDEQAFRDAWRDGFHIQKAHSCQGLGVFLPNAAGDVDIRSLVPFYQTVYVPFDSLSDGSSFGMSWAETLGLMELGRLVPVISRPIYELDPRTLRDVTDRGHYVTPRKLVAATAGNLLATHPLWRVADAEPLLARQIIAELRSHLHALGDAPLKRAARAWLDFEIDGCTNFQASLSDRRNLAAIHHGPGALLARVGALDQPRDPRELSVTFAGLDVAHAMALGAVCAPPRNQTRLYELLVAAPAAPPTGSAADSGADAPAVVAQLDYILRNVITKWPDAIPVREWIDVVDPIASELRASMEVAFSRLDDTSVDAVQQRATELEWALEQYDARAERSRAAVSRFERLDLLGFGLDAVSIATGLDYPFVGTALGYALSRGVPRLWSKLQASESTRFAVDLLQALDARVSPNIVRLHRIRSHVQAQLGVRHEDH